MLFDNPEFEFVCPFDWSPDGNWILVELTRMDHTDQMGLISVRDGSLRVLKSAEWSGSTELFFSPDGKYIGFDARVGDTSNAPRDVFILAVDGSRQVPVTEGSSNDTMMGWSPDGKYVLVASDRGGSTGLWAVPLVDGRPKGTPELVKADISRFSLGVSASGSLYTGVPAGDRDIRVASVDFETGRLLAAPVRPAQSFVGTNSRPVWSPDGKYLAYTSNRPPPVYNSFLMVQSVETGQLRELKPKLTYINNFRWTPDGQGFIVGGRDLKGRQGQYHVDGQTTEVTPITAMGQSSPDGRKVYFRKDLGPDGFAFVERELVSGAERELVRGKDLRGLGLSPDGRFIATAHTDGKSWILLLVPISGGETRELLRVSKPQSLSVNLTWMADSRAVLVNKGLNENDTENELWFVPIAGGQPHKIDLGADQFEGAVNVHPDGRRIAYVSGDRREEVWVLENFLPALNAKK